MKLVPGYQLRAIDDNNYLAFPSDSAAAHHKVLLALNETGAFMFRALQTETDRDRLLQQLREEYDAPDDLLEADLDSFLSQLREAELLI